ncbi:RagB/SusD family nutrient uptake outer membrane protein [Dysgonomonas sp. BGC7]|uniref:RagB/SusD family nutrient uptake outer membrane protein n=1 Tax=Dysgonomonas sp. BGC7 TaxID=1658008 RepID=UPI00067F8F4D|nr:RagB/SusD family nutrient uptake outer membrane protein [Dysgonomonas sp. BGC7]MBD8388748.1 RagB/SusD family nutrient uptake outer membrane protein [Dysgonomonas sp. BGC7]
MKNIIYSLCIILSASFFSCDETLDIRSESEITSPDKELTTEAQVRAALVGCYNGMQKPMETEWMLTELRSDNAVQGVPTSTNSVNLEFNELDMFTLLPTHPRVYDYWIDSYSNIGRTNTVLACISVIKDENERKSIEAQCRFIRAYHYFNLVRLFGPLFITTENISPDQAKLKDRSPVEDVYSLIISDLNSANSTALPEKWDDTNLGRASRLAAKTMLAKVYLTIGQPHNALPLLTEIKLSTKHRLLPYAEVFSIKNEMNDEIIFAIRYKSGGYGLGSPFANRFAPTSSGSTIINGDGSGWNFPSYDFMSYAYEPNDARREVTVSTFGTGTWVKNYVKKYISPVSITFDAENDWPILRYSDVLLMLAEILNEKEGHAAALPLVNEVRSVHGNLPALSMINNQDDCRLAIEKERRVEFAFENQRFFDLVRTKRAVDVLNNQFYTTDKAFYTRYKETAPKPGEVVKEWQLLLPIPQREIDTNNKVVITQNYGY